MKYDRRHHHRRSIRLRGYDYSRPGMYFVTACTQGGKHLFGTVAEGRMDLNKAGEIVVRCWNELPKHYPHVALDAFVAMPNHVHSIVRIVPQDVVGAGLRPAPTPPTQAGRHAIPEIVRAFKSFSARGIHEPSGTYPGTVWQRNYYEHIIRNEDELNKIREYIRTNPLRWACDRYNPDRGVLVMDETGAPTMWENQI